MPRSERLFGALIIIFFILFLSLLILPMEFFALPPVQPPLPIDLFEIFWGWRWYDMIFLVLALFVTIAGISSLFRAEKPGVPTEEAAIEGYVEEEIEEEE